MSKKRVSYTVLFELKATFVIVKTLSQLMNSSRYIIKRSPILSIDPYDSRYHYDQYERVRATINIANVGGSETPLAPFTVQDYDWQGNVVGVAQFETEPDWNVVATTPNFTNTATGRLSFTKDSYNIHSRIWKTEVLNNVSNNFDTTTFKHDLVGRDISTTHNNTTVENVYDALGHRSGTIFH